MEKFYISLLTLLVCASSYATTPTAEFKLTATIAKGCVLSSDTQTLDFSQHSSISQEKVTANIVNSAQSWNIRCTETMPVNIALNGGENYSTNQWRMKHLQANQFVNYRLYQDAAQVNEYPVGKQVALTPTTTQDNILKFSIYGVADLSNNNQSRATGIYKDSIAITISW
ncbi:spore coat protein U-like protein [Acinetobacter calcoaceticus]|uniref:Spore coat protein U-like protein n=1 Tax=Acinetobacter calcoaceticus TaxID=471 RepID=A0A4R1XNM0_ACICA|nr:spore coat protein U-like protein [Acinetobacter calcoaceticus]